MAVKKASTSIKQVQEAEQRVLATAPEFFQEDQEDVFRYYPTGVGFVRAKYRVEGGSETTARGTVLPYEEPIPQVTALTVEMSRTIRDTRTGLYQDKPIVETMRLPFRTDNCLMNIKHKIKSSDLIGALMMFEGYNKTFEIIPVTSDQKKMEKELLHKSREDVINAGSKYIGAEAVNDAVGALDGLKKRD